MTTYKSYSREIIIDCEQILTYLKLINVSEEYFLFGISDNKVFVYSLSEGDVSNFETSVNTTWDVDTQEDILNTWDSNHKKRQPLEILEAMYDIVNFIDVGKTIYVLDTFGQLYALIQSIFTSECSEDNDLFEDSPKDNHKWTLERKHGLNVKVLAVTVCSRGLVILTPSDLTIYELTAFEQLYSINYPSELISSTNKISLISFSTEELNEIYIKNWLPNIGKEFRATDAIVFSGSGVNVYMCVLGLEGISELTVIYESVQRVIDIMWFEGFKLILSSGGIVHLTPQKEEVSFIPVSNIVATHFTDGVLIVTDTDICCQVEMPDATSFSILPNRGLVTFCGVPNNPKIFLASTYHKSVYSIKIGALSAGEMIGNEGQLLDEGRLLDEMVDGLQQLEDMNQEIKKQQEFHRVLSIAARGPLLSPHFDLKLQVVQILGQHHTFRIKIRIDIPEFTFSSSMWKLSVSFVSSGRRYYSLKELTNDFNHENPLIEFINTILPPFEDHLIVNVKFMSQVSSEGHWISIPLKEIVLDCTHFLQPRNVATIREDMLEYTDSLLTTVLAGTSMKNKVPYLTKWPLSSGDQSQVLLKILTNSRALWRASEWAKLGESMDLNVVLFGWPVGLSVKNNVLLISCEKIKICFFLKCAVIKLLSKKPTVSFESNLLTTLKNLEHKIEVINYEIKDTSEPLTDIYSELRDAVSKNMVL